MMKERQFQRQLGNVVELKDAQKKDKKTGKGRSGRDKLTVVEGVYARSRAERLLEGTYRSIPTPVDEAKKIKSKLEEFDERAEDYKQELLDERKKAT